MKTKFWTLYTRNSNDYDSYTSFIIEAKSAHRARKIAQEEGGDETNNGPFWTDVKLTGCAELKLCGMEGIVSSSFKVG